MRVKGEDGRQRKIQTAPQVRATTSFPLEVHTNLAMIAKKKKVSLAWVVREAAEHYLAEK